MAGARARLKEAENAAVRSWPALESADIDGWLWRFSSGGSLRANSVATLAFYGRDVEAAIDAAEERYRAKGAASRFTISRLSEPADLDQRLAARGYVAGAGHATLLKEVAPAPAAASEVTLSHTPTQDWLGVYLAGLAPDRREIAPTILAGLPAERTFLSCHRLGAVVASGLSLREGRLASVQCMATRPDMRRQGCASDVLGAIEAWAGARRATHLYLQAELSNVGAMALYARFGFYEAGQYHVRYKARP
jgi:ribosomal protein S18 acetylase RimI-like enzyme